MAAIRLKSWEKATKGWKSNWDCKSILERQFLRSKAVQRFTSLQKKLHLQTVLQFQNNCPKSQIAVTHLQSMISSTHLEKLEKSLCVRDKAENQC